MSLPNPRKKVSIVISVFNEQENIPALYTALKTTLNPIDFDFEFLFVNDGSTDLSLEILMGLMQDDPRVKVVNLGRNFGHEIAMTAGMDYAHGDCVLFMDADLQHPPALIPQMLVQWQQGYDLVLTHRVGNHQHGLWDKLLNRIFYTLLNILSDSKIPADMPDFRLIDQRYVTVLKQMREHHRLFRGLINWMGIKNHTVLAFEAPARFAGTTKYSFRKLLSLAIDSIISFSIKPLRIATYAGLLAALLSIIMGIYFVYEFLHNPDYSFSGFGTTLVMVVFLGSVQLVVLGIIGEYVGRIHIESKKRPLYFADFLHLERQHDK